MELKSEIAVRFACEWIPGSPGGISEVSNDDPSLDERFGNP